VLACLIGYFGDFDLAEEATAEAFAVAAQRWPDTGTPDNPGAWLVTTARHRAIDRLRRDRVLAAKLPLLAEPEPRGPGEDAMDGPPIPDERLELVFMCCHPALAIEAQVALTLRAVAGLTTEEIARAFLVPAETMKRRLTRAKSKIKVAGIPFGVPAASQLPERLAAVLAVVYLIFNEGYSHANASTGTPRGPNSSVASAAPPRPGRPTARHSRWPAPSPSAASSNAGSRKPKHSQLSPPRPPARRAGERRRNHMALPTRPIRTAPAPDDTTTPHGSWLMLAVLLLGQFMCIIDVLVTNVAMPSIAASLHASGASLQLVVGGYTIAYAMLLITGARLGDRYGRRRAYLAGVLVFTAASLACALAPDSQALIGFRLVQGAGAAVLVPQVFSIIQLNFTGPARARALSAYAAVLSAGAVTGLVLGGVVVTANLFGTGWRPVFAINVPIGIALAAAVPRLVPPDETSRDASAAGRTKKLDLAGLATAACAVLLIVLPLVLGHQERWPAWCFACIAVGAVLAAGFVLIERRVAARGGDPLLNLAVLRAPALPSGLVTLAATQIGYGGLLFAYTLHLQAGLGESALRAGLSYLPFAAVFGLAGYNWRRLPAAVRRVLVPAGLTVGILAYLALAAGLHGAGLHGAGLHGAGPHGGIGALTWAGLTAVGLGLGLSVSPLLTQSLTNVPAARAADASGLLTTTVQLGQLLGVAVIGSVYLSRAGSGSGSRISTTGRAAASAAAMSGTACWLAVLSAAGLVAAAVMVRAARRRSSVRP
jgi:RNA polymerase sigma factor (sigma-70 family)